MAIMANKDVVKVLAAIGVLTQSTAMAEPMFKPSLTTNAVGLYQKSAAGKDRVGSLDIAPSLSFSEEGKTLSTSASVGGSFITFRDSVRDDESYMTYNWRNQLKLLGDSVVVGFSTSQDYRIAGNGSFGGRGLDKYNASDRLVKSRSTQLTESWKFDRSTYWSLNANFSLSDYRSDGLEDETLTTSDPLLSSVDLDNQVASINLQLDSRDRSRAFFWGITANHNNTSRQQLGDLTTKSLYGVVGMPFFYTIKMIGQARVERNSGLTETETSSLFASAANYRSVGGGLEWQIGNQSYWNVTYNTLMSNEGNKAYVGTQLEFKPTRRTKLSATLDRRFFGRTAEFSGEYTTQHLRMKISGSDQVGSLLALSSAGASTGLYVCPPGATPSLDSCFQPPTKDYIPRVGENYYNISTPGTDLNEFTVIRRSADFVLGYDFNRLKLQSQIGRRKDTYVNQNSVRDERNFGASANYELNKRMSASLNFNVSDSSSDDVTVTPIESSFSGEFRNVSFSLNRQMNKQLSGVLQVSRSNNDYDNEEFAFNENRLTLTLTYQL